MLNYVLKLKANPDNPAYNCVFKPDFEDLHDVKKNEPKPLSLRVRPLLQAAGVDINSVDESVFPATPPWTLPIPEVRLDLTSHKKAETPDPIYFHGLQQILADFPGFRRIFTDGSKSEDGRVGAAAVMDVAIEHRINPLEPQKNSLPPTSHTRAFVNDKCKPKRCRQECKKSCPVVRMGKLCIEVAPTDKIAFISEELCIGCGICAKKCPFEAISIINLPSNLERETTHRYSANSFKLHRLPTPRPGEVLGLVGTNGIGKSTALKILAGKQKPNLGRFNDPPDWTEILAYFRGSELQNFFTKILEDDLKALIKPQYVDQIPKAVKMLLDKKDELKNQDDVCKQLDLMNVKGTNVEDLSGGELQRFAIAIVCIQKADIFMFDEPSSYLDVKQRLKAAQMIRSLIRAGELHHRGINIFLDGFVPTENLRFRESALTFKVAETALEEEIKRMCRYDYPKLKKKLGQFTLTVEPGEFTDSEIIVMLGENGTGKTTFIKMLAGKLESLGPTPVLNVSYKPQKISPKHQGTVRQLLHERIRDAYIHPQFVTDVVKPLQIEPIFDQEVQNLSGGELQRVALTLCLGKPADVYLIDEPSAYLDSEQRLHAAKVIKRPRSLLSGMNQFLESLDITFRRDPNNFRPRINKLNSVKDVEQKRGGNFFFLED
nr:hypothetical protein BaRGS_015954 [Batillaria attramentaria]